MRLLGISAFYHDSAAALVADGEIVCAAQEERFSRKRHDAGFPSESARFCLQHAGISMADLDAVVFYEKPFLKFERLIETSLAVAPRGFASFRKALPVWKTKLFQKHLLEKELASLCDDKSFGGEILFTEHHQAHAASAFFASPFEEALILTMDGVGEWATTSAAVGKGSRIRPLKEIRFPHSVGLLYSAFTHYTGFKVNSAEYKVMGLAPYGKPVYKNLILEKIVDLKDDGSFRLDLSYFDYGTGLKMTNRRFHDLFGGPPRAPSEPLTPRHMDLAASVQAVTEEIILKMTRALAIETGQRRLCLAGGVALNCVANGKILRDGRFEEIWIQPAAGDAGGAVGAALAAYHGHFQKPRVSQLNEATKKDGMSGAFLGPRFSQAETETRLKKQGAKFRVLPDSELIAAAVDAIKRQQAVGWFQGAMEFGPRALGARSILADPRSSDMQKILNMKIKFRESFRPSAPAVLREDLEEWFDLPCDSPYMLLVADVAKNRHRLMTGSEKSLFETNRLNFVRSEIPAVSHVDGSARVQTVHEETNPRFYRLLQAFKRETGCPVLVNTSFNVRGEPIVCTPEDAFKCFMGTDLDSLAIENCWLKKEDQDPALRSAYHSEVAPD